MKTFSPGAPRKPLDRSKAGKCLLINQCATPGLGSLFAGRWIAGTGQLTLALIGFGLFLAWFVNIAVKFYSLISDSNTDEQLDFRLLKLGLSIFAVAWLWAWFTSISIMREAKSTHDRELNSPPR
jgi:hypothetical protein